MTDRAVPGAVPLAVLLDCDGVLVDSEPVANRTLAAFLTEHGLAHTAEECARRFIGLNPRGVGARILAEGGPDLREALVRDFTPRIIDAMRDGVPIVAGMDRLLAELASRGIPLAAVSNSPIEELSLKLRVTGLAKHFAGHVHSADALGIPKPAADVYLHAARLLGIDPRACVVVEDSPTGIRAGVAAGARVIAFTGAGHAAPDEVLRGAGAHEIARDAAELRSLLGLAQA